MIVERDEVLDSSHDCDGRFRTVVLSLGPLVWAEQVEILRCLARDAAVRGRNAGELPCSASVIRAVLHLLPLAADHLSESVHQCSQHGIAA